MKEILKARMKTLPDYHYRESKEEWEKRVFTKSNKLPNPYYKYNLDVREPFIAVIKTPKIKYLESIINLLHYGKSVQLKDTYPYRLTKDGVMRYKGQYWLTKYGRVKVRF